MLHRRARLCRRDVKLLSHRLLHQHRARVLVLEDGELLDDVAVRVDGDGGGEVVDDEVVERDEDEGVDAARELVAPVVRVADLLEHLVERVAERGGDERRRGLRRSEELGRVRSEQHVAEDGAADDEGDAHDEELAEERRRDVRRIEEHVELREVAQVRRQQAVAEQHADADDDRVQVAHLVVGAHLERVEQEEDGEDDVHHVGREAEVDPAHAEIAPQLVLPAQRPLLFVSKLIVRRTRGRG